MERLFNLLDLIILFISSSVFLLFAAKIVNAKRRSFKRVFFTTLIDGIAFRLILYFLDLSIPMLGGSITFSELILISIIPSFFVFSIITMLIFGTTFCEGILAELIRWPPSIYLSIIIIGLLTFSITGFPFMSQITTFKSNWLFAHISCSYLAYGAFFISFLYAIGYLIGLAIMKKETEGLKILQSVEGKIAFLGLLFLSFSIITGSMWAKDAWGSYWAWDPKEIWSLTTWIIYAAYLHRRYFLEKHGRCMAYISIICFIFTLLLYAVTSAILSNLSF